MCAVCCRKHDLVTWISKGGGKQSKETTSVNFSCYLHILALVSGNLGHNDALSPCGYSGKIQVQESEKRGWENICIVPAPTKVLSSWLHIFYYASVYVLKSYIVSTLENLLEVEGLAYYQRRADRLPTVYKRK